MAYGVAENPGRSVGAQLEGVDFPVSRETLVQIAGDNGGTADVINLYKSLPRERYETREEVERDFAEAARRFAMGGSSEDDGAYRDRRNIGRDAVEGAPDGMTRHP